MNKIKVILSKEEYNKVVELLNNKDKEYIKIKQSKSKSLFTQANNTSLN